MIDKIYIDGFKSLKGVALNLPQLIFLCGPNASGKSNFAEAFDFVSQTFSNGLSYAVAEKGGFYNMCFRSELGAEGPVVIRVEGHTNWALPGINTVRFVADFSLRSSDEAIRSDFVVQNEEYNFIILGEANDTSTLRISRQRDTYVVKSKNTKGLSRRIPWLAEAQKFFESLFKVEPRELLFPAKMWALFPLDTVATEAAGIRVFRINPRTAKQAGTPSVTGELGKHGENLPSALEYMMTKDRRGFETLEKWLREVIPGLRGLSTGYTETKQLGLFLLEKGLKEPWYSEELSDGTLMSIALFLAILDQRHRFTIIEEPENSLHPWLLRRFLDCCREVSAERQLLVSTQSPIVVANATPENLFLVEKHDRRTFITPAIEREPNLPLIIRQEFLDLGEYWLSGGLEAVPTPPDTDQQTLFRANQVE